MEQEKGLSALLVVTKGLKEYGKCGSQSTKEKQSVSKAGRVDVEEK